MKKRAKIPVVECPKPFRSISLFEVESSPKRENRTEPS